MLANFFSSLQWRGMVQDSTPGLEQQLAQEVTTGYIGFDPTASSLHIGHLPAIMLLKHLQLSGHKPVAVIGGATGMIGDPSFKAQERRLLDQATIQHNVACIQQQLTQWLDTNHPTSAAILLNNADWFQSINLISFLRDIGKYLSIAYMLGKESVKKRIATGISYTEFAYPLLQAYDFFYLYTHYDIKLQMGGADQWGNLTTGMELIRKKVGKSSTFSLTTPLITKADGSKFGKTEAGNIWLDAQQTSPYQFYQFWLNSTDQDAIRYIKVFTMLSNKTIDQYIAKHQTAPHQRILQKVLAKEVTLFVHGDAHYQRAYRSSNMLFGNLTQEDLMTIDESNLLEICANIPHIIVKRAQFNSASTIVSLLAVSSEQSIFASKSEARKMIQNGGVYINTIRIEDVTQQLTYQSLLHDKYLLIQKGKKKYYLMIVNEGI